LDYEDLTSVHCHIGGTFSCVDIFVALYYGNVLRLDPHNPRWQERDRLVIGKGHACLALYNIWVDLGFFDISRLQEYGNNGSSLSGQLNIDTPGVEYNSGSLGHALGIGAGMALAAKMDKKRYRTFCLVGDGECAEGSIWESIMFAAKYRLNNLIGIIDHNRLSVIETIDDEQSDRLERMIKASGWECITINGHCFENILSVFNDLDKLQNPLMVIANTIKGKGVSFMENGVKWHHSVPSTEQLELAKRELDNGI
ncbi:MAG: transketolase, partial [Phycisphaerales bacterium]|jgi:transketolase